MLWVRDTGSQATPVVSLPQQEGSTSANLFVEEMELSDFCTSKEVFAQSKFRPSRAAFLCQIMRPKKSGILERLPTGIGVTVAWVRYLSDKDDKHKAFSKYEVEPNGPDLLLSAVIWAQGPARYV